MKEHSLILGKRKEIHMS